MGVIGYYYFDHNDREVLHVPRVFIVIEPPMDETEVILEPRKLKSRLKGLQRVIENGIRIIKAVSIKEEDAQRVIQLCFEHKLGKTRRRCEKIFDRVTEHLAESYQDRYDPDFGFDTDGYDPRFRGSLF